MIAKTRTASVALLASALAACAAGRKSAEAPASSQPASEPADAYGQQYQAAPPPSPPPPSTPSPSGDAPSQPGAAAGSFAPPNRALALSQATNDIESSQRELDVAGGDCRNACRALGSMDRAAGRLCGLAQSTDEQRRCGDAKTRVYSARDKVKNTCGSCPDVSVDRDAPIPSRP